jgi:hypothetical protein
MTRFAALGDSITVGMGDPAPGRGWAALLASTLPQPELHNLATLGALAADVERAQLPAATALRPDVASVVVGINDTLRGDFDPERTGHCVDRTVAGASIGCIRTNAGIASSPAASTRCWAHPGSRSARDPTPSRPARRRPGWPRCTRWRPRARPGWSGGRATWSRPWWAWPCANGSGPAAKSRNRMYGTEISGSGESGA